MSNCLPKGVAGKSSFVLSALQGAHENLLRGLRFLCFSKEDISLNGQETPLWGRASKLSLGTQGKEEWEAEELRRGPDKGLQSSSGQDPEGDGVL